MFVLVDCYCEFVLKCLIELIFFLKAWSFFNVCTNFSMVYCPLPKKKGFFFHLLHLGCIVVYVICRDCKILPLMFICETCNQSINLFSDMKVGMLDFIGLNCLWVLLIDYFLVYVLLFKWANLCCFQLVFWDNVEKEDQVNPEGSTSHWSNGNLWYQFWVSCFGEQWQKQLNFQFPSSVCGYGS